MGLRHPQDSQTPTCWLPAPRNSSTRDRKCLLMGVGVGPLAFPTFVLQTHVSRDTPRMCKSCNSPGDFSCVLARAFQTCKSHFSSCCWMYEEIEIGKEVVSSDNDLKATVKVIVWWWLVCSRGSTWGVQARLHGAQGTLCAPLYMVELHFVCSILRQDLLGFQNSACREHTLGRASLSLQIVHYCWERRGM